MTRQTSSFKTQLRKPCSPFVLVGLSTFATALLTTSVSAQTVPAGLSLQLEMSVVENTTDSIRTRVALQNTSDKPTTLTAHWAYEHETGDYSDYFESLVGFRTDPRTYIMTQQTAGNMRRTSQPQHVLNPGETISAEWLENCGHIKPQKSSYCLAPRLHEPGRYIVHAYFNPDSRSGSLKSNPVTLDFGASNKRPVHTSARISAVDNDTSTVLLESGSDDGLQANQRFRMQTSTASGFDFKVVSTGSKVSTASVSEYRPSGWPAPATVLSTGSLIWRTDTMESRECARDSQPSGGPAAWAKWRLAIAAVLTTLVVLIIGVKALTRSSAAEQLS